MNTNINFLLSNQSIAAHVTELGNQVEIVADSADDLNRAVSVFIEDAKFEEEEYTIVYRSSKIAMLNRK